MSALYVALATDLAYRLPSPSAYGWAFARSLDPGARELVSGVLLREGLVYLLRDSLTHTGRYTTDTATAGSSALSPSGVTGRASGVPLAFFLSEMNFRWRTWAVDVGIDPSLSAGAAAYGGPVWAGEGQALSTLESAAIAWGWDRL